MLALFMLLCGATQASAGGGGVLAKPIDARQQTALTFGDRSHWLQPWRAYLDTPPATRLRDAIGINFNVDASEADATARLLAESGFKRARLELGWSSLDFDNPGRFRQPETVRTYLTALRDHGIRPLILLNSNHGVPCPTRFFTATILEPARMGDRRVKLSPDTAAVSVPGHTGLSEDGKSAAVLFTSIAADGTATLSRPLPTDLAAGGHPAATLRYEPFGQPRLEDGRPNPRFEETLRGWLAYVGTVTRDAHRILGHNFDLEVWNELSFGSDFLYQERYYDPPRERGDTSDTTKEILNRTVAYLRDPANGFPRVPVSDGFASQAPWASGSTTPPGLTALSKHPYMGLQHFPADTRTDPTLALDARGRHDFVKARGSGGTIRRDRFVPRYDAFLPEFSLTAIRTEHLVRDISPLTSDVYGVAHGRRTRRRGARAPQVWITEANLDPSGANPASPGASADRPLPRLNAGDVEHLQAKAALRYYTAYANKGVSAIHLFAVKGHNLELVNPNFFDVLAGSGGRYPGRGPAGETPAAIHRLTGELTGAARLRRTRPLSLLSISDRHNHKQFNGDGTAAHPPLFDRDVLAFFPFELRPGRYVASVYVMTRSLAKLYRPGAPGSDRRRFDLPPAWFRLTIGGVNGHRVRASATDPLTGARVPARIVRRAADRVTLAMRVTDSPRILRLATAARRLRARHRKRDH